MRYSNHLLMRYLQYHREVEVSLYEVPSLIIPLRITVPNENMQLTSNPFIRTSRSNITRQLHLLSGCITKFSYSQTQVTKISVFCRSSK